MKNLFNLIINAENQINNMRRTMVTLRIKLRDIFGLIDYMRRGYFDNNDLLEYMKKEREKGMRLVDCMMSQLAD